MWFQNSINIDSFVKNHHNITCIEYLPDVLLVVLIVRPISEQSLELGVKRLMLWPKEFVHNLQQLVATQQTLAEEVQTLDKLHPHVRRHACEHLLHLQH